MFVLTASICHLGLDAFHAAVDATPKVGVAVECAALLEADSVVVRAGLCHQHRRHGQHQQRLTEHGGSQQTAAVVRECGHASHQSFFDTRNYLCRGSCGRVQVAWLQFLACYSTANFRHEEADACGRNTSSGAECTEDLDL